MCGVSGSDSETLQFFGDGVTWLVLLECPLVEGVDYGLEIVLASMQVGDLRQEEQP